VLAAPNIVKTMRRREAACDIAMHSYQRWCCYGPNRQYPRYVRRGWRRAI